MYAHDLVRIPLDTVRIEAEVVLPTAAGGVILFADEIGSSSRRDRSVAQALQHAELGTVRPGLLSAEANPDQRGTRQPRDAVRLLAGRLAGIVDWLAEQAKTAERPVGMFGADGGGAAALVAAAERPAAIRAVVSFGGHLDLAEDALPRVPVPALLIVGDDDDELLEVNRRVRDELPPGTQVETVPGKAHVAEEPEVLERVGGLASEWFTRHLGTAPSVTPSE